MNQILSTENNYSKRKQIKQSDFIDMKKIIIIFSVLLIVFAIIIIGAKIFGNLNNKDRDNKSIANLNEPNIDLNILDGNICQIVINYDEGLDQITYWWNDSDKTINYANNSEDFKKTIAIPEGNNVLHVKATGKDGSSNELNQTFPIETRSDNSEAPKIAYYTNATTTEVIITSTKDIQSVTYHWENEEPTSVTISEEERHEKRIQIENKRGMNRLYITATDIEGNTQEEQTPLLWGVHKPIIKYIIENNTLKINITHDMGFKKIIIKVNEKELIYDDANPQYSKDITSIEITDELEPGKINVEVTVYTLEQPDEAYTENRWAEI